MEPLWAPDKARIEGASLTSFQRLVEQQHNISLGSYQALHQWSVEQPAAFWTAVWSFTGIVSSRGPGTPLLDAGNLPGTTWFPDARRQTY